MAETDSMPRLQHLVPHLAALLKTVGAQGATFEECRERYAVTVRELAASGQGRITVSRVGDADAYWSPTQEVLDEAMRLEWVEKAPTPSARKYLDDYRDRVYRLSSDGLQAASKVDDHAAFADIVTRAVLQAHATMRSMLRMLGDAPLVIPEATESLLEQAKSHDAPTRWLALWAADRINGGPTGAVVTVDQVHTEIGDWRSKRFGTSLTEAPAQKDMVDMVKDAYASIALKARGLPIGPIAFRVAANWGASLRLIDQSRYVPHFDGANVVWRACDVSEGLAEASATPAGNGSDSAQSAVPFSVTRRGMASYGRKTAEAVITAYQHMASEQSAKLGMAAPYLPLHKVRAEGAFNVSVTRALADMAIEALAEQRWPDLGVEVFFHAGVDQVPASEPVYQRGGRRRTGLSIQPSK